MRKTCTFLMIAVMFIAAVPVPRAAAAGPSRVLARTSVPTKVETCRPRWPFIVLTCVA